MVNRSRATGLAFALCLLGAWVIANPTRVIGRSSQQVPIFKGRLDVVRTEVSVVDNRTGKAITGLTERDFTIAENGKRQDISSFVDQSQTQADAAPAGASVTTDPDRRVFLFITAVNPGMFANATYKTYDGIIQFIRERLRPQDLVGVMYFGRLTPLTTDHERIATIVERAKTIPTARLWDAQRRDGRLTHDLGNDYARFIDEWLDPKGASTGFFQSAIKFLWGTQLYEQNFQADINQDWNFRLGISDALKCLAGIEYLRPIQGRKHLVLAGAGFNPPFSFINEGIGLHFYDSDDDRRFAARANDAGVAIDIIQTSGTGASAFMTMSNQGVSEQSGGQFSSLRIASQQLARVDNATRHGYILGYVPDNPELDNKYRNIKVTVNRKDVTVVYRHGYTAATEPPHIDPREAFTRSRLREAARGNTSFNEIRVQAKASPVATASAARQMRIDLTIDMSAIPLTETAGNWEADIDLLVLWGDPKQNVVCKLDQHMHLAMNRELYEKAKAGGVPYSATLPATGPVSLVKVIVYHFDGDRLGTTTVAIK